jgi:hypothetical protein
MGYKPAGRYGGLVRRVQRQLDRITCTWFPLSWHVQRGLGDVIEIRCQATVTERDTREPTPVSTMRFIAAASAREMADEDLHALGRRIVHDVVVHEIDEHLLVDGKRTWDPHAHTVWL